MKKLLLLIIFTYSILSSFAQYESLLADTTRQWNIYNSNRQYYTEDIIEKYFLSFTVSFNSAQYTKIYAEDYGSHTRRDIGYLREDTSLGKLWFKSDTVVGYPEFLIYDLSLNEGDTFKIFTTQFAPKMVVDTAYYISGKKHIKLSFLNSRYYLTLFNTHQLGYSYDTLLFVEGVGTSRGFDLIPNTPAFDFNYSTSSDYLICAYKDSALIYNPVLPVSMQPVVDCDSLTLGIHTGVEKVKGNGILIAPNPTKSIVNIPYVDGLEGVEVYDVKGTSVSRCTQKRTSSVFDGASRYNVASATILDDQSKKYRDAFLVDLTNQPNGIYILKLTMKNGEVFTKKVIKE